MQCYSELLPPTGVTHAVKAAFCSPSARNLIVAKSTLLQIFDIIETTGQQKLTSPPQPSHQPASPSNQHQDTAAAAKLVLVAEHVFPGVVADLATVRLSSTTNASKPSDSDAAAATDSLLVSTRNAKLSLVEWDPHAHRVSNVSIHLYENEETHCNPWVPDLSRCPTHLAVDPHSRCAVLHYCLNRLAILPFRWASDDDLVMDDFDEEFGEAASSGMGANAPAQPEDGETANAAQPSTQSHHSPSSKQDTDTSLSETRLPPYLPSYVVPLPALDPHLTHPRCLEFLSEYREPTFGILYSALSPSNNLSTEHKDALVYSIVTLDLDHRSLTKLVTVTHLPSDLYQIVPLPLPVGGALLIGANELVHVDQAGKTSAVGVNDFARVASGLAMADRSALAMRLEDCAFEHLGTGNGDMLMMLADGRMAVLGFKMDGRSVSGMSVHVVSAAAGGDRLAVAPTCSANLGDGLLFIGGEEMDSLLLSCRKAEMRPKRKTHARGDQSHVPDDDNDDDESDIDGDDDVDDDDDLYSTSPRNATLPGGDTNHNHDHDHSMDVPRDPYVFRELDHLPSLGPMTDIAFGRPFSRPAAASTTDESTASSSPSSELELLATQGRGKYSALTAMRQKLDPDVVGTLEVEGAHSVWAVRCTDADAGTSVGKAEVDGDGRGTDYLFVAAPHSEGEETRVYKFEAPKPESEAHSDAAPSYQLVRPADFNPSHERTIDVGSVARARRVVQVLSSEVRSYDHEMELAQIYPVFDDDDADGDVETDANAQEGKHAVTATFADPYIAIIRADRSLLLLQADKSGDLDEVLLGEDLQRSRSWVAASLYVDSGRFFGRSTSTANTNPNVLLFLLDTEGRVQIFVLPDVAQPACVIDGLGLLPPSLPLTTPIRRTMQREDLAELVVADLGDWVHRAPYFIVLSTSGEVIIYEPFHAPTQSRNSSPTSSAPQSPFVPSSQSPLASLRLSRISRQSMYDFFGGQSAHSQSQSPSQSQPYSHPALRVLPDVAGYHMVFVPGPAPRFIVRTAASHPHIVGLRGGNVQSLCGVDSAVCERGFAYLDDSVRGVVRICRIPADISLDMSWVTRRVPLGQEAVALCYHPGKDVYAVGTSRAVNFKLPDDDEIHPEWQSESLAFFPQMQTGSVQLYETSSWGLIDEIELSDPAERVMCVKCINMTVSEITDKRRDMVVVGTAIVKGEDVPARGCIYVYDVVDVVPDPDCPTRSRRLKLLASEKVKGAVTAVSAVGDQGFVMMSQGQKCMVRGLKEDGSLLPTAFMDTQCYMTTLKELKGTGLCIMSDAIRGMWFTGYSEEPYHLTLFSKDTDNLQVLHADFLPDGKRLFIIASDEDCNLHIFQYDPEDPTSSNGDRLLHRSSFQTGHLVSTVTLLPRAAQPTPPARLPNSRDHTSHAMDIDTVPTSDAGTNAAAYQVLVTSTSGQMSLVTPLSEDSYRRLSALQAHLTNALEHPCGLNPRAFRAVRSDVVGGRGMVDGPLLQRFLDLGPQKRVEMARRAGAEAWEVCADLAVVGGTGLAYL
ncbi:mRNA cleavage and polyadenylation factor subunit [Ascosphaera acerosa]|nr:mRNA cleavage and polyadenylation factor subunit [Ascosphaera acerosa]